METSISRLEQGNLTSQLFSNIYLNELDRFVKHELRCPFYIRYADDFVIFDSSRERLLALIPHIRRFLEEKLRLRMHTNKIELRTVASGTDFLGWVHFSHHRVLRSATKRRMFRRIVERPTDEILQSYLGLLSHGDAWGRSVRIRNVQWLWSVEAGMMEEG